MSQFHFPENIFKVCREERDDFIHNFVEIVKGYEFSQYETIKKIHLYYNSQFVDGKYETINGVKRQNVFYNLNKWRCDVWTKQMDIDTKDFVLVSEKPETDWNVHLLEKELKAWLKRNRMGKVLNEVVRYLPIYGSVVLKKVKEGAEVVDLRNLMCDQSAKDLKSSRYVLIKNLMSPGELRKMNGIWENVDEAIKSQCTFTSQSYEGEGQVNKAVSSPYAEVWERYGEVPLSWFTDKDKDDDKWTLAKYIITGVNDVRKNEEGKTYMDDGIILYKEQIKELPFKEVHANKTEGRWLGIGVVEDLFEAQRMRNRVANIEDRALEFAGLVVHQGTDSTVVKNLGSDVNNGDIIISKSPLTRLDTTQKSLAEFRSVAQDYEVLANRQSFNADTLSGEVPPASATATAVITSVQQASSVFDYKRENIGLFLEEYFEDIVFPELEKEINKEHWFRYVGSPDEMGKLRGKIADTVIGQAMENLTNIDPAIIEEEKKRLIEHLSKQSHIGVDVQAKFFKELEYYVDLTITGESRNVQNQLTNLNFLIGEYAKNPQAFTQDPVLRRLFFKQLTLLGVSPTELDLLEKEASTNNQQQQAQQQQQMMADQQQQQLMQSAQQKVNTLAG